MTTHAMTLDASGSPTSPPHALGDGAAPTLAHGVRGPGIEVRDGNAFVAWPAGTEVLVAQVGSGASTTVARIPAGGPVASLVSIAPAGDGHALAWSTGHGVALQVFDAGFTPIGERLVLDEDPAARRAAQSTVTATGDSLGLAYVASGSDALEGLQYARVSAGGAIDGEVSAALPGTWAGLPRLIFDGRSLYAAWQASPGSDTGAPTVVFMELGCTEIGELI